MSLLQLDNVLKLLHFRFTITERKIPKTTLVWSQFWASRVPTDSLLQDPWGKTCWVLANFWHLTRLFNQSVMTMRPPLKRKFGPHSGALWGFSFCEVCWDQTLNLRHMFPPVTTSNISFSQEPILQNCNYFLLILWGISFFCLQRLLFCLWNISSVHKFPRLSESFHLTNFR